MAVYKHVLDEVLKPETVAALQLALVKPGDVKFGAHQVTAVLRETAVLWSFELFFVGLSVVFVFDG